LVVDGGDAAPMAVGWTLVQCDTCFVAENGVHVELTQPEDHGYHAFVASLNRYGVLGDDFFFWSAALAGYHSLDATLARHQSVENGET
jgi:hypothetical protein